MKALILLILPAVLFAQLPKPGAGGGGGGSSTGSSNPSCTFASSATTCSIDVSSLNVTSANYKSILAECFTGASTTQTPVTITNYAYTTGSGIVQTVAPTFGAAAAAGYCAANGNGGAGPTGAPGATGATGPTGTTGAAGAGYLATSTTSLIISTGLKVFTTQAGLAYTAGAFVRVSSAANGNNYMQGLATSYSGTALTINVTETGGAGTLADWNINLVGNTGATGATGAAGPGYQATSTTSFATGTGSKTFTTQAGLAYVTGALVRVVSAGTPGDWMQGQLTSYSGTSLVVNVNEVSGSGTHTDWNISIAGVTGTSGSGGGISYGVDTSVTPNVLTTSATGFTYTDGATIQVAVANDSTGSSTLNVNGLGNIPITTTTGLAMFTTAFKAGGVYTFIYKGGSFQLVGSGACIQVSTGLSCGIGWITLRGTTSGFRVYNTEFVAGNDGVNIAGYLATAPPTAGNCVQWGNSGGTPGGPVIAQTLSGCVQKFFGTAAPGSVAGNLPGDTFTDTTAHNQYVCGAPSGTAAPACTSVTAAGWLLVNGGGAGSVTMQVNGSSAVSGSGSTINLASSSGLSMTASNAGGIPTDTISPDTSILATRATAQSATDTTCVPVSGSPTAYTCVLPSPLTAYTSGMRMVLKPDVNCTAGTITLAIDGLSPARKLFAQDGSTNLTAAQCATTTQPLMIYDGTLDSGTGAWRVMTGGGSTTDTPIDNGSWSPYGGVDPFAAVFTTAPAANKVWYYQIEVPRPGRVVRNIKVFSATGTTHVAWGIYDSSCNVVVQAPGTGPGQNFLNIAVTPTTLTPGIYYVALSADGAQNYFTAGFDGSGYGAGMANLGLGSSTYRIFEGQNVSVTTSGTTVLPSSCGATRTVLGDTTSITSVKVIPVMELQ